MFQAKHQEIFPNKAVLQLKIREVRQKMMAETNLDDMKPRTPSLVSAPATVGQMSMAMTAATLAPANTLQLATAVTPATVFSHVPSQTQGTLPEGQVPIVTIVSSDVQQLGQPRPPATQQK